MIATRGYGMLVLATLIATGAAAQPCALDNGCPDLDALAAPIFGGDWGSSGSDGDIDSNGMIDSWELALFEAVLCSPDHPLLETTSCTFEANRIEFQLETNYSALASLEDLVLAFVSLNAGMRAAFFALVQDVAPLSGSYTSVTDNSQTVFSPSFDIDGDGVSNGQEAANAYALNKTQDQFVAAALDPQLDGAECEGDIGPCPEFISQGQAADPDFGTLADDVDSDANGIIDSWEISLFEAVLCDDTQPLYLDTRCTYQRNLTAWGDDVYADPLDPVRDYFVAYFTISSSSQAEAIALATSLVGAPTQTYEVMTFPTKAPNEPFAADADLDGDGHTNGSEAGNVAALGGSRNDYVIAALDPQLDGTECIAFDGDCPDFDTEGASLYTLLAEDWMTADIFGDGIVDRWQVLAFADAVCAPDSEIEEGAICAFRANRTVFETEPQYNGLQPVQNIIVALLTLSTETQTAVVQGAGFVGAYQAYEIPGAKLPDEPYAADGDLDGDGHTNLTEYQNTLNNGLTLEDYINASANPLLDGSTSVSNLPVTGPGAMAVLITAILLLASRSRRNMIVM